VHAARPIPPNGRHRRLTALKRPSASLSLVPENAHGSPPQVLHCLPLPAPRGMFLEFQSFDDAYVERLRAGDFRTQEHFVAYFSRLIQLKLHSRLRSREAIEDVRQETFARFFVSLSNGKILHAERLGSFVNSTCTNVFREYCRNRVREDTHDDVEQTELPSLALDALSALAAKEAQKKVREILEKLPKRDRRLLKEVFLEERDKDEVCRELNVDREYLRVLLCRAKKSFKSWYLKK